MANGAESDAVFAKVDQSFGGVFTADTPAPDRQNPTCEEGTPPPWVGNAEPVNFGG